MSPLRLGCASIGSVRGGVSAGAGGWTTSGRCARGSSAAGAAEGVSPASSCRAIEGGGAESGRELRKGWVVAASFAVAAGSRRMARLIVYSRPLRGRSAALRASCAGGAGASAVRFGRAASTASGVPMGGLSGTWDASTDAALVAMAGASGAGSACDSAARRSTIGGVSGCVDACDWPATGAGDRVSMLELAGSAGGASSGVIVA